MFIALQLCQICADNPDMILLKVDYDENRDIVKPLGIKVCSCYILAGKHRKHICDCNIYLPGEQ